MHPEWLNPLCLSLSKANPQLILPLLFALAMGWNDARTRRIPNYLTLSCALAGLGYQLGFHGLAGLTDGLLGMVLGFGLLILFYLKGGMGAGDVKALAALGTWLGVWWTIYLFVYMAFAGVVLVTLVLWWQGTLWSRIKRGLGFLAERVLLRPLPDASDAPAPAGPGKSEGVPYAVAMAVGMAIICWRGFGG
ncbi:MAG: A24 family peptidase [Desulfobaccales bacterium]